MRDKPGTVRLTVDMNHSDKPRDKPRDPAEMYYYYTVHKTTTTTAVAIPFL